MDSKTYWTTQHQKYLTADWIDKTTKFAQEAITYFPKNAKILELGCGQGQDSRYFAELGFDVIAADFSEEALTIAREKTSRANLDITFQNVDLSKPLPFDDNSFDVVYSHLALHYFDAKTTETLFREIARVLVSGGILATILNTTDDNETKEGHQQIEEDYYNVNGLLKRYFTPKTVEQFTEGKFTTVISDNKGATHKDKISSLIRFVGKKI